MSQDKAGEYEVGRKGSRKSKYFIFLTQGTLSDNRCQAEKIMSCEWNVFQ